MIGEKETQPSEPHIRVDIGSIEKRVMDSA